MSFRTVELLQDEEDRQRRAREEQRRRQRQRLAESSSWPRIDLEALRFERYTIEDTRTGEKYRRYRGEVEDAANTPVIASEERGERQEGMGWMSRVQRC